MDQENISRFIFISFMKVNEQYKIITDEKYELQSIDGKKTNIFSEIGEYNHQRIKDRTDNDPLTMNAIPDFILEELDNIHTIIDIQNLASNYDNIFQIFDYPYLNEITIKYKVPVVLKQVNQNTGYKSSDILMWIEGRRFLNYDNDSNIDNHYAQSIETNNFFGFIDYDMEIPQIHSLDELSNYIDNVEEIDIENACYNSNYGYIITEESLCTEFESLDFISSSYHVLPYFLSERVITQLEITNTVNGLEKYNASKERNLEYQIEVKNIGENDSTNNIIKTNVPKEVIVNEQSISDNGVYDQANNTITWTIERIPAGTTKKVTYKALAPESTEGKELIGNSVVSSNEVTTTVHSNNTIVTLDKIIEIINNPYTGTTIYIANTNIGIPLPLLLGFIVLLCMTVSIIAIHRNKKHD